ncbi:MAG: hypothetical protein ACE14Q_05650 [Acidobacteriota bacterium]|nr:hypothetical protein [Thermoanaerobaculaceae bacterium]
MSYKEIIEEKLSGSLKELENSLLNLKEELGKIASMVPQPPDVSTLSREIEEAIPEPAPQVVVKEVETTKEAAPRGIALNNKLLYYIGKLEYCSNQAEVLKEMLEFLKDYASRCFVCIVKENGAKVWNHFGCENLKIQSLTIDISKDPLLKSLLANRSRLILDNSVPDFIPVKDEPKRCLISPLLLKGKVAAFVYADSGSDGILDHYSIDILIKTASLVLDLMPLRPKRDPLPPTLEEIGIITKGEEKSASPSEELFVESGEYAESPLERTTPSKPPELEEVEAVEESKPFTPVEVVEEEPAVPEEIKVEAPPPPPKVEEEEPVPPEEMKEHESAKRFARLLVQEIGLYHPDEIERAKQEKNLLSLLRDDIEKSREAYEQRYKKPSIRKRDYFNKALIQYLANGDPSVLGK